MFCTFNFNLVTIHIIIIIVYENTIMSGECVSDFSSEGILLYYNIIVCIVLCNLFC